MMPRPKKYDDSYNEKIFELYVNKNMSLSQVSQKLDIHPEIVKRRLQNMGVDTRNRSQAMSNYHEHKKDRLK